MHIEKIMTKMEITVGVDIGGTNTELGFITEEGKYVASESILTDAENNSDAISFINRLACKIKDLYKLLSDRYELKGIGIAAPSANYFNGTIESASNLSWEKVDFVNLLQSHFNIPVAIINDANAAALGEQTFGSARGINNFVILTLGTGLGSGIVVNGNLLHGKNGFAGELGHTVVETDGRKCKCGKSGCLETYISATGLRRTVFNLLCKYTEASELRGISFNDLTGEKISELALKNDLIAKQAFEITGEVLGKALANVAACFDPEAIILFGGLAESGDLLLEPTRRYFEQYLLSIYKGKINILKSGLLNGKAAVLGASRLILNEIKDGRFSNKALIS